MASSFKVLIVGGGPVGLTAALALSRANISFTLLEKHHTVLSEAGSSLMLLPTGLRSLSQLGLFDALYATSTPMTVTQVVLDHNGRGLSQRRIFQIFGEEFGQAPRLLQRRNLCTVLYKAIPNPESILCSKTIMEIQETDQGVKAICSDGTTYTADMIIGADGVHSAVRRQMTGSKATALERPTSISENPDGVITAQHRCVWMRFPVLPGLPVGGSFEVHAAGASAQVFVGDDHVACGLYEKLETPINRRVRFTKDEEEEVINRWADLPLTPGGSVTLGMAYSQKAASGMVPLQEGVWECWSSASGRTVLVGDAAHVFSPITGSGCNSGIIDVVVLSNKLRALLEAASNKAPPRTPQIRDMVSCYETTRKGRVSAECQVAMDRMDAASSGSLVSWLMDAYLLSWEWVERYFMSYAVAKIAVTPFF